MCLLSSEIIHKTGSEAIAIFLHPKNIDPSPKFSFFVPKANFSFTPIKLSLFYLNLEFTPSLSQFSRSNSIYFLIRFQTLYKSHPDQLHLIPVSSQPSFPHTNCTLTTSSPIPRTSPYLVNFET